MARPIKKGLEYFPLDVNFFEDDKLQFISAKFGEKGEMIAIKILCKVYRDEGYFMRWDEDAALLFSKKIGVNFTCDLVTEVVYELVKREFFDKEIFSRHNVLTSSGIQNRYKNIITSARRKGCEINEIIDLTNVEKEFPHVKSTDNRHLKQDKQHLPPPEKEFPHVETTQSKVKEIKEKKTKGNKTKENNSEESKMIHSGLKKLFEDFYLKKFKEAYYWDAKNATNLNLLIKKIEFKIREKFPGENPTKERIMQGFEHILLAVTDPWLLQNFSIPNINSKFNEIVQQIQNKTKKTNGTAAAERTNDRHEAARLAKERLENQFNIASGTQQPSTGTIGT